MQTIHFQLVTTYSKVFTVIVSQFFNEVSSRYYSIINYTYIPVLEVLRLLKTRPQFFHGSLSRASSCKKATTYSAKTRSWQAQTCEFETGVLKRRWGEVA